jgi:hypothetical protein
VNLDLNLIGNKFMENWLPPESAYLHKYFKSEIDRALVSYYLMFGDLIMMRNIKFFIDNFVDHTGLACSQQRLRYSLNRIQSLLDTTQRAEQNFDLEQVEIIKSGKYKFV